MSPPKLRLQSSQFCPLTTEISNVNPFSNLNLKGSNFHSQRSLKNRTLSVRGTENPWEPLQRTITSSSLASYSLAKQKTMLRQSTFRSTSKVSMQSGRRQTKINQYRLDQLLGCGSYGKVYLCTDTDDDSKYALKEIKRTKCRNFYGSSSGITKSSDTEMETLKQLNHANIVRLIEIIDDPKSDHLYLVMDYIPGGSLAEKLKGTEQGLEEEDVRVLF